jgi:hypothetical protein
MNSTFPYNTISAACGLALLTPLATLGAPPDATPAFDSVAESTLSAKQKQAGGQHKGRKAVKQVYTIKMRPGLDKKTTKADRVQFAVGPGNTVEHRFHHIEKRADGYTWFGGDPHGMSHSAIVVHGNDMVGSIRENGKLYRIESAGDGAQQVIEVDESKIQMEGLGDLKKLGLNDTATEPVANRSDPDRPPAVDPTMTQAPRLFLSESPPPPTTTINVLVVYTQAAYDQTAAAIEWGTIPLAASETNSAFKNSSAGSIAIQVVKIAKVTYTEKDITADLNALRYKDGNMDEVFTLRDANKADLVIMITGNYGISGTCGLAPLNTGLSADSGFAVVSNFCSTGIYGFAHELGHTMGLDHDTYVVQKEGRSTAGYNHGYVNMGLYHTIMAYDLACTDRGLSCAPIMYFSNPSVSYLLTATGTTATENNAKVLLDNAVKVAAFRL